MGRRRSIRAGHANFDAPFEMQFPRAPVIVKPVRDIRVLLHLDQREPGPDRMNRSGRGKKAIARPNVNPVEQLLDFTARRGLRQSLGRNGLAQTDGNLGAGIRTQDVPHLRLAARILVFAPAYSSFGCTCTESRSL